MRGVGNGLRNWTEAERRGKRLGGGEGFGIDDTLLVVEVFVERQQEAGALAVANRTGDRTFVVLPPLGGLNDREGVCSIEDGIAKQKVQGSVIVRRPSFGNDFQASPAGTREARRVRIVVDLYFLNGRRSDARSVGFHAVHDQRDPVG